MSWVSGKLQKQAESHPWQRRALSLAVPGGIIGGSIGQGLLEGGLRLAEGKGTTEAAGGAVAAGGGSVAGGLVGKGLAQGTRLLGGPSAQRAYEAARGAWEAGKKTASELYEKALASREGKMAFDKGFSEALSVLDKRAANEQAAGTLMDYLRAKVPVFKGMGKGSAGLDEVTSTGAWNKLHQWYDSYMKDLVKAGTGKTIRLGVDEAKSLGLTSAAAPSFPIPGGVQRFGPAGPMPTNTQADLTTVSVDAGQAAEKALGLWKKNPKLYRTIVNQLDEQGLGDPEMRSAYRTAMAARDWLKKNNLVKTGEFDLTKAQQAQRGTGSKPLDVRASGVGEDIEGIVKGVQVPTKRIPPSAPPMPGKPVAPPEPTPPPSLQIPHPWALGAGAVELPLIAMGHHGYGAPAILGGMAANTLLPRSLPLGPPTTLGTILQSLFPRLGAAGMGYISESTNP